MKKLLFIFIFIIILIPISNAHSYSVYDRTAASCHKYVTDYEQASSEYLLFNMDGGISTTDENFIKILKIELWIATFYGYITAVNVLNDNERFNESVSERNAIAIELKNWCEDNPSSKFLFAIVSVGAKFVLD